MLYSIILIIACSSCGHLEKGKASFYGSKGGKTASGEKVNPKALTAAHRTLPFNTIVEVTAVKTGKKVRVRITDRGPFIKGRIIDLTPGAFKRLASLRKGVIKVTLRIIKMGKKRKRRRRRKRKGKRKKRVSRMGPFGPRPQTSLLKPEE
jgi:peptidoglycan lytic transglycosylase